MKQTIALMTLIALFIPCAYSQSLALNTLPSKQELIPYSNLEFVHHRPHHRPNPKMVAGIVLLSTGGSALYGGLFCFAFLGYTQTEDGGQNVPMQQLGIGIMVAGSIMAITGGILMKKGHDEKKRGYGLQFIAPKPNEIGLAYNF